MADGCLYVVASCNSRWPMLPWTTVRYAVAIGRVYFCCSGGDIEAEQQMGMLAKRQHFDAAETQPCSSSVLDTCPGQFLMLAEPYSCQWAELCESRDRWTHLHYQREPQQVSQSMRLVASNHHLYPVSRIAKRTCVPCRQPLPANGCSARPHDCSRTDEICWLQRKQICCCNKYRLNTE